MVFIHLALFSCLHSAEADIQALNTRRAWVIDQLSALIRNGAIPKSDAWIQTILDWLAVYGLFIIARKSEKAAITAVSSSCLCPRVRGLGVAGAPACSAVRGWWTEIADY